MLSRSVVPEVGCGCGRAAVTLAALDDVSAGVAQAREDLSVALRAIAAGVAFIARALFHSRESGVGALERSEVGTRRGNRVGDRCAGACGGGLPGTTQERFTLPRR